MEAGKGGKELVGLASDAATADAEQILLDGRDHREHARDLEFP